MVEYFLPLQVGAHGRRGFTLVEILIVVVILGILASIMVPSLSNASSAARESTLHEDLRYLRTQVGCFKYQHREVPPGYPSGDLTATPDETTFLDQMTRYSDELCNTSTNQSTVYRLVQESTAYQRSCYPFRQFPV